MIRRETRSERGRRRHRNHLGDNASVACRDRNLATLLSRLTDADLSNDTFPYLSARQIHVGYAPVLAVRVTYLGELGWELHIPTEYAAGVFDELTAAGADLGLRPVGLAAMSSLRLEKGYRDIGVDIDNTDNPIEAGLGFAIAWDKPGGFVGRDALLEFKAQGPVQNRVVSLLVEDPSADLFGNEPVTVDGKWVGYVRAAAYGYTLGGPVGLASVSHEAGVTADWLRETAFTVPHPGRRSAGTAAAAAVLRPGSNRASSTPKPDHEAPSCQRAEQLVECLGHGGVGVDLVAKLGRGDTVAHREGDGVDHFV